MSCREQAQGYACDCAISWFKAPWYRLPRCDWYIGGWSGYSPHAASCCRIVRSAPDVQRWLSTSSIRTSHWPSWALASSQLASAATNEPACKGPVGEGAKRPMQPSRPLTLYRFLPPEDAVDRSGRPVAARSRSLKAFFTERLKPIQALTQIHLPPDAPSTSRHKRLCPICGPTNDSCRVAR